MASLIFTFTEPMVLEISGSASPSLFSSSRGSSSDGGLTNTKCFRISVVARGSLFMGKEMIENKAGGGMGGPEEPRPKMSRI